MKKKKTSKEKNLNKNESNISDKTNKIEHKKVKRKIKKEEKKKENVMFINSNIKALKDEKKRKKIEDVLKRKKLDILKKKLNEYTKEKLLEKFKEIKEKEKLERLAAKRKLAEKIKVNNNIRPISYNDDDLLSVNENEIDNKSFISENGNESESVRTTDSISDSEILYNVDSNSKDDDESFDDDKSTDMVSDMSSVMSISLEIPKINKKESPMIKKLFQKHIEENINNNNNSNNNSNNKNINNNRLSVTKDVKDKPAQENEINKYIKMDNTLAQAYIHFCKKVKIPYNDFYSQFIADNVTKEKINEFLYTKTSNKKVVNKENDNISINNNNDNNNGYSNEVTVDAGTSGFRNRYTYFGTPQPKKPKIPLEKIRKLKLIQSLRVEIINSLLSYNENVILWKQLQKDNKELYKKKKTLEITLNKRVGKLIKEIDYITNDICEYHNTTKQRRDNLELHYNNFSKKIEKYIIELDIIHYKKKKEYDNLLKELQQLKQFEEKINSHPELLLNEIEILNEKIKKEDEIYKNELKRMELREKTKQKEMEDIKKQSINYLILESYNHVSPKLIDSYIKKVEDNKRLHYEINTQKEFQNSLYGDIDKLKKENEELQKNYTKKINSYNIATNPINQKSKCPPNEIYKFDSKPNEGTPLSKRQILLNKLQKMNKPSVNTITNNKSISIDNITTGLSQSNKKLFDEVNAALSNKNKNVIFYNNSEHMKTTGKKTNLRENFLYTYLKSDNYTTTNNNIIEPQ